MIRRPIETIGIAVALVTATSAAAFAQLRPQPQTQPPPPSSALTTESVEAGLAGNDAKALALADEAIQKDAKDPWGYFNRGDALRALHRTDEAVSAFRDAEARMTPGDLWGRSVAIWGQADALARDGRCRDAAPVYERYAAAVENADRASADLARLYARHCTPRGETK